MNIIYITISVCLLLGGIHFLLYILYSLIQGCLEDKQGGFFGGVMLVCDW